MIVQRSGVDYSETVEALLATIGQRGLTVFARIDHAAGARAAGLELAEEQVIVFGSPLTGTPLMQSDPRVGIELPLRMLVWRDGEDVLVGHDDPRELGERYEVSSHRDTLEKMAALLDGLAQAATGRSA